MLPYVWSLSFITIVYKNAPTVELTDRDVSIYCVFSYFISALLKKHIPNTLNRSSGRDLDWNDHKQDKTLIIPVDPPLWLQICKQPATGMDTLFYRKAYTKDK